jgi:uncharacterized protein (DUF433 family)
MTTASLPNHVLIDDRGCAWIEGTKVKVIEVAMDHIAHGWSADEISRQHPGLTLGQVHSALSCYYDNASEFDQEIGASLERCDRMARAKSNSPLRSKLRAKGLLD